MKNIDFEAPKGSLIAVVGRIGSGKSTLLSAILGETHKIEGDVGLNCGSLAYVSQQPWIQNMTVKNNVVFGQTKLDEAWYDTVR